MQVLDGTPCLVIPLWCCYLRYLKIFFHNIAPHIYLHFRYAFVFADQRMQPFIDVCMCV